MYTIPRHEKSLARHLLVRGIEHFLPLYCVRRKWNDGSRVILELPLFPGYIFVRLSRHSRVRVLESPGALYFVAGIDAEPARIVDSDIDKLRHGLLREHTQPHPLLTVGQRVRVTRGALTGMEGILQRLKSGFRVVITMELLMQSVAVEMEMSDFEVLNTGSNSTKMELTGAQRHPERN